MAGGLYKFEPNWKCVVFTALMAGGYWFLPSKNRVILVLLLIVPYIGMAWYDEMYRCQVKLKPTLIPFGRTLFLPFKPPAYQAEYDALPPEAKAAMDSLDHATAWACLVLLLCSAARVYTE